MYYVMGSGWVNSMDLSRPSASTVGSGADVDMNKPEHGDFLDLYPSMAFGGAQSNLEDSEFVLIGAPLDSTGTFRTGYREAPNAIRTVSAQIEQYSYRFSVDASKANVHDLGDLVLGPDPAKNVGVVEKTVRQITAMSKIPIILGGEHTITFGGFLGSEADRLIVFDAHMDLRDEYLGSKFSHATWLRRLLERVDLSRVLHVGTRSTSEDELASNPPRIEMVTSDTLTARRFEGVKKWVKPGLKYYASIDLDVFDPPHAPGVGNPEPEGISPTIFFDLLKELSPLDIVGFDVCELIPKYDPSGITTILASKIVLELLCAKIA